MFWQHFSNRVRTAIDAEALPSSGWAEWLRWPVLVPLGAAALLVIAMLLRTPTPSEPIAELVYGADVSSATADDIALADDRWVLVADIVGEMDWDTASAAGLVVEPGDAEQAVFAAERRRAARIDAAAPIRAATREVIRDKEKCWRSFSVSGWRSPQDLQPQQPPPQGGGAGPLPGLSGGEMSPAEIQKLFDAYLVMEAQQALALTDQQYPQFLARLRTLQDMRRRNQQQRIQLMGQLQRLTNPRAAERGDEAAIKERLAALQELESRGAAEMRKAYTALDEVLDVRQQARFRVFEEQIERRKIELLMRARQQNRQQNQPPLKRPNRPPPGV